MSAASSFKTTIRIQHHRIRSAVLDFSLFESLVSTLRFFHPRLFDLGRGLTVFQTSQKFFCELRSCPTWQRQGINEQLFCVRAHALTLRTGRNLQIMCWTGTTVRVASFVRGTFGHELVL